LPVLIVAASGGGLLEARIDDVTTTAESKPQ
jgi:hypothetical protein